MSSQPTNAGIITDAAGVRHIPESTRADGSTRRAIKIRPGYQPPEDVALYKARMAENFRSRYKNGVPGAEVKEESQPAAATSATPASTSRGVPGAAPAAPTLTETTDTSNKNAKRREARKKAAAAAAETAKSEKTTDTNTASTSSTTTTAPPPSAAASAATPVDDAADREKKARGLKKKLKQAKELKNKRDDGEALLPEQIAKVIRINELVRELDALGFDAEGESKT